MPAAHLQVHGFTVRQKSCRYEVEGADHVRRLLPVALSVRESAMALLCAAAMYTVLKTTKGQGPSSGWGSCINVLITDT